MVWLIALTVTGSYLARWLRRQVIETDYLLEFESKLYYFLVIYPGKLFNLVLPQFAHLSNGDNNNNYPRFIVKIK